MEKALIEEASTELLELFDELSEEARKEKNAVPPINEILYWWTRKPLVVGRAMSLSSTLNDITAVKDLLGLKRKKRAYTYIPDADVYKNRLGKDPSQIKVFDPFGGAGNLIFEAKRLGLDCYVGEYNPVAYIIMKCTLEYPLRFGSKLSDDIIKYGSELINRTKAEIAKFYLRNGKNALSYFWCWCIKCPFCKQRVPLTNQMWLVNTQNKKIGVRFELTHDQNFRVKIIRDMRETEGKQFTQKAGKAICIKCRNSIGNKELTNDIAKNRDREMIAIAVQSRMGKDYEVPTMRDKQSFEESQKYLKSLWNDFEENGLIPTEEPKANRGSNIYAYGIKTWSLFFSERQLLVMLILLRNIKQIAKEISDRDYSKVIATYLTLFLCKHVNCNCLGVTWQVARETLAHALTFRTPRIIYNHVEVNPFEKTSGGLEGMLNDFGKAVKFASSLPSISNIFLKSALHLDAQYENNFDLVLTDPPYMDDVPYGEVSDFFYVWLYRGLKDFYPELPSTCPIEEDITVSRTRFGSGQLAYLFYEKAMKEAFKQIYKSLKLDGLLILFFAHSSTQAWNLLLEVLREAKFKVVSSYAIHTENIANVIARGKTSFMSSIVVVCRKLNQDSVAYYEDIIPIVEDKVKSMLSKISAEKLLLIPITDLLIMVYGKVLEATTNHTELRSYEKDFKPDFESLISNSRDFIFREIITKLTGRSINLLGSQMSSYLLTKIFYRGILDGDNLLKVTRTYGLTKDRIEKDNLGKNEDGFIRLYYLHENKIEKKPEEIDSKNIHEQLCYLSQIVDGKVLAKLNNVLSQPNFRIDDLKQVVSLLLKSFRLRVNKKESLTPEEQKELKILETIADTMGMKSESSLESFM